IRLARLYAYGSFFLRPLRMEGFLLDFKANTFGAPALSNNVRPNPDRIAKIETVDDLRRFCAWIADDTAEDLLDAHSDYTARTPNANHSGLGDPPAAPSSLASGL